MQRVLISSCLCALLTAAAWLLYLPASPAAALARGMVGERWYRLSLNEKHLGYWHTSTLRNPHGDWVFESEQRFAMNPGDPVATITRRVFESNPPHSLVLAEQRQTRRSYSTGIRFEQTLSGYQSRRIGENSQSTPTPLSFSYTLTDYLEFELWLDADKPPAGTSRVSQILDFERSSLINSTFNIAAQNASGYVIENDAPLSATSIELDDRYMPTGVKIAGLFSLDLSSRERALSPRSSLQWQSYSIPTDRPLPDHTRISRLLLAVDGHETPWRFFSSMYEEQGQWLLELEANPLSDQGSGEFLEETLSFPIRHPDIVSLADSITNGIERDLDKARALLNFVNGFLRYTPGAPRIPVLTLLTRNRGDCTEFADLLTTLARATGIPSRTVFGLAYSEAEQPAFAFHAWNELQVEDAWVAMDPTWGQDIVDATHIPLPGDDSAALQLLSGSAELEFFVREVEHFSD